PPLDPPGEYSLFQGLRAGPDVSGSVIFFKANSGTLVCPVMINPASRNLLTKWESPSAIKFCISLAPDVRGSPFKLWEIFLRRKGIPEYMPFSFHKTASLRAASFR